jgi:hypothetical protein
MDGGLLGHERHQWQQLLLHRCHRLGYSDYQMPEGPLDVDLEGMQGIKDENIATGSRYVLLPPTISTHASKLNADAIVRLGRACDERARPRGPYIRSCNFRDWEEDSAFRH